MAQSSTVNLTGVLTSQPASPSFFSCSAQELLPVSFCATYGSAKGGGISVASTDSVPFSLPFEGITKARVFAMRLMSGATMKLKITTALGVATLPCSDEFVLHNPNPGDEILSIQLIGTGDILYALVGDVS